MVDWDTERETYQPDEGGVDAEHRNMHDGAAEKREGVLSKIRRLLGRD